MSLGDPIRLSLEQQEDFAFLIRFEERPDALLTDEPPPLGKGAGPSPALLLLGGVANCLCASLLFALRKYRNTPGRLRADVEAAAERNDAGRWRIPRAKVTLHLAEAASAHRELERILGQFEQFCIVTQSVREGLDVAVSIRDADGRELWSHAEGGAKA